MAAITEISLVVLVVTGVSYIFWLMKKDMETRHARMMAELGELHEAQKKAMTLWAHTETTTIEEMLKPDNPEQDEFAEEWTQEDNTERYNNQYVCPKCNYTWENTMTAVSTDDCPVCHIAVEPHSYRWES